MDVVFSTIGLIAGLVGAGVLFRYGMRAPQGPSSIGTTKDAVYRGHHRDVSSSLSISNPAAPPRGFRATPLALRTGARRCGWPKLKLEHVEDPPASQHDRSKRGNQRLSSLPLVWSAPTTAAASDTVGRFGGFVTMYMGEGC